MMRFNVLDNSTVGTANDERLAESTAQESVQVPRENPIGIGDNF
jgi:hypothetical protein